MRGFSRYWWLHCVVFLLILAAAASAQIPDVPGWQLLWHDEFDGPNVDTSRWEVLTRPQSYNNELQYYLPEQASIVSGNLRITATNQPIADKQYRSARLESWATFGPGRFEARIDLPTGQGMWPAFWLFPNRKIDWPLGGEIDILENRGSEPTIISSAYHWPAQEGQCCVSQYVSQNYTATDGGSPLNFHAGFHTYAVEWDAAELRFYVDGILHFVVTESGERPIFETPKNIILNLAVGGIFGGDPDGTTVFPQTMDVDYVRVWQRPTGLAGDYNRNDVVDVSDYVVWQKSFGQSGLGLAADGSGNGTVGPSDYDVWRSHFGNAARALSTPTLVLLVPETGAIPISALLAIFSARPGRYRFRDR
jgi:beta-glucanase (GH16 family)